MRSCSSKAKCVAAIRCPYQPRSHVDHRPQIGRLVARPRLWANRQIEAGVFGGVVPRGRLLAVDLGAVEQVVGLRFTREQLLAAGLYVPDPDQEEAA
jgi:hypothetical protein